ncbi:MAG: VPLPA-CTERM sorting domain-containing protein [Gammaproteobacteria bacterium]|nr:MAG: VPLPA-CTERM sorting domain-containing protein [Gammaproteobacteria bacterium]
MKSEIGPQVTLASNWIRRWGLARLLLPAALASLLSSPAVAMTVIYAWTPDTGQGGTGTLTLSSPGISDPANFSAIAASSLTGMTYQWNNGALINLGSILTNNAPSWTACNGYLITGFQITAKSVPPTSGTFSLMNSAGSCLAGPVALPGPGYNATNSVMYGPEGNSGHWTFQSTVVPVPAAGWLLASACAALAGARRRLKS